MYLLLHIYQNYACSFFLYFWIPRIFEKCFKPYNMFLLQANSIYQRISVEQLHKRFMSNWLLIMVNYEYVDPLTILFLIIHIYTYERKRQRDILLLIMKIFFSKIQSYWTLTTFLQSSVLFNTEKQFQVCDSASNVHQIQVS